MSIRTTTRWTCPVAGWLTISAGERAVDGPVPELPARCNGRSADRRRRCRGRRPGLRRPARPQRRRPLLGRSASSATRSRGRRLHHRGRSGAALQRPTRAGGSRRTSRRTRRWTPRHSTDAPDGRRCRLSGPPTLTGRRTRRPATRRLRAVDDRVGEVVAAAPPEATIIVVGMSDRSTTPHLTVATARGPAADGAGTTRAGSRRGRPGARRWCS